MCFCCANEERQRITKGTADFLKRSRCTLYLITDPHPSQNSKEVRQFSTRLKQHFAYSKILRNGQIDLSYTLACLKRKFERTLVKLIVLLCFGIILLSNDLSSQILQRKTYSNSKARMPTWPPSRSRVTF